ncbi:c-type cytochrome biogenesis protein CcmI [Paracoccus sediminicola]|uniref:c-type cytochrome biogenesis protein CcmI n=1 Tax=Paracoccus sediminicola TaxID=3017783 RepID=UPI0022F13E23|nr:c-type cytochrome biogenesis protein CcmI [Paracoccus sediminicola]WBU56987.1 c-type cytochrome biogenesis protein CcmI [Paracoccus sediminicola]
MFWLSAAALILIVAAAILWPFRRARQQAEQPAAAYDLRIYRDQLTEVERDLSRGIIEPAEAERLRAEIGRKVLEADRAVERAEIADGTGQSHALAGAGLLLLVIAGAVGLYLSLGAPSQPDMGLQSRIAAAQQRYDARPSQAEAEARAADSRADSAARAQQGADPQTLALIDQLRDAVKQRPDDPRGYEFLARNEARLGNSLAAKDAQRRLIELRGDTASSQDYAFLAGLMTEAAGGVITAEAEAELTRALERDPSNAQARYMAGLLQAQNGRPDRAFPIWSALLEETPAESPWNMTIRPMIADIAWLAGQPDYIPPEPGDAVLPGPDADQMAAAADMTPAERATFIRGMVERLESRLATQGGTPEEWARLISSLTRMGELDRAAAIHSEAQQVFAASPEALAMLDIAARESGLIE